MRNSSREMGTAGVKVYLIDPKDCQRLLSRKPTELQNGTSVSESLGRRISTVSQQNTNKNPSDGHMSNQSSSTTSTRATVTEILAKENRHSNPKVDGFEADDVELIQILAKRCKTRFGRETKPIVRSDGTRSDSMVIPHQQHVRRKGREPPEFFRCQTCRKFYLGNKKLKEHFQKFPAHQPSLEYQKANAPKRKIGQASVAVQSEIPNIASIATTLQTEAGCSSSQSVLPTSGHSCPEPEFVMPPMSRLPPPIEVIFPSATSTGLEMTGRPNSMNVQSPSLFQEVNASPITVQTPSPSSNSLPFWNSFSNFSNGGRGEASPDDRPESSAGNGLTHSTTRKEELLEINSGLKTVWEVVERKLSQSGINHILMELSDVAEKLGKIARDKIIPIREDEEERLPTSTPIVRVENPFMSHLLDLPFGAYVFREDGGIRRPPLPPPSTDLSLTAGEVDIDKFLACNMEMDLSLPHLTSLDIAAVCNN